MTNEEFLMLLKTEESKRAILEIVIADLKANGPVRMALVGLYPERQDEKKPDA